MQCSGQLEVNDLGDDAEVNLKPLGGWLVAGAPGETVGQVDARVALGAASVPLGRVDGRGRQLAVVNVAGDHAQRLWLLAR